MVRLDILKMLQVALKLLKRTSDATCFADTTLNDWFNKYLCYGQEHGIIQGYTDGTFQPGKSINVVEALKIVLEVFESEETLSSFAFEDNGNWYDIYQQFTESRDLYLEEWAQVNQEITRGEMAKLISAFID